MRETPLLRLRRIEVDGLFGIYDHRIDLNLRDRVTLLHGPNGVGKTSVLRMVDALLRNDFACFKRIPFARFLLEFEDGSTLELRALRNVESSGGEGAGALRLTRSDGASDTGQVDLRPSEAASIAARIDYLQPHSHRRDAWIDVRNGEVLSEIDVLSRFGDNRGDEWFRLWSSRIADSSSSGESPWLDAFLESTNAFLIEAQRLVRIESSVRPKTGFGRGSFAFVSSVLECSLDFQRRLRDTMAAYGRYAQTLDQSFPRRLISATNQLAPGELRKRMTDLDKKTDELRALGILDKTPDRPEKTDEPRALGILDETPDRPFNAASLDKMDSTEARVMTLYVEDVERKLRALEDLASRLRLLLNSVNGKFRNKRMRLDEEKRLATENQGSQRLPLDSLSSGEQHELVLHYDLLFRVPSNTVVLIDEPELSLHVGWQKKFLSDLTEIVKLSGLDAVVATHSPFIVGDRDDLLVGLGD